MYHHIEGKITHLNPAYVVLDAGGIGFLVNISLHTYEKIQKQQRAILLTHFVVKEDGHALYGFAEEEERELFRHLISISGIGPNTARTMLSYLSPKELGRAIINGDVAFLKSVKGIGPKSAQRIVVELQDVLKKSMNTDTLGINTPGNRQTDEAVTALVMLGFAKPQAEKAVAKILVDTKGQDITVEELIKKSLQQL